MVRIPATGGTVLPGQFWPHRSALRSLRVQKGWEHAEVRSLALKRKQFNLILRGSATKKMHTSTRKQREAWVVPTQLVLKGLL